MWGEDKSSQVAWGGILKQVLLLGGGILKKARIFVIITNLNVLYYHCSSYLNEFSDKNYLPTNTYH